MRNRVQAANEMLSLAIRILLIVGVIVVGILVWQACNNSGIVERKEPEPPQGILVTTKTYNYYVEVAEPHDDGSMTITGWYRLVDNKWQYNKGSITLPRILQPRISASNPPE